EPTDVDSLRVLANRVVPPGSPVVTEALAVCAVLRWLSELWTETEQVKTRRDYAALAHGAPQELPPSWLAAVHHADETRWNTPASPSSTLKRPASLQACNTASPRSRSSTPMRAELSPTNGPRCSTRNVTSAHKGSTGYTPPMSATPQRSTRSQATLPNACVAGWWSRTTGRSTRGICAPNSLASNSTLCRTTTPACARCAWWMRRCSAPAGHSSTVVPRQGFRSETGTRLATTRWLPRNYSRSSSNTTQRPSRPPQPSCRLRT